MLSAAVVVAYGLGTGFDRAAQPADLPDVIVRFDPLGADGVIRRIEALPDIARYSLRFEALTGRDRVRRPPAERRLSRRCSTRPARGRGYAVVAGRDLSGSGFRGPDREGVRVGVGDPVWETRSMSAGSEPERVVGFAQSPDDVGYPLGGTPLLPLAARHQAAVRRRARNPQVNLAEIWLRDPRVPERGARPGPRDELRPAQHPLRDAARGCACCSTRPPGS